MTSDPEFPPAEAERTEGVLSVIVELGPDRVLARVSGEIDIDDAGRLGEDLAAALSAGRNGLDVDLTGVTFCDSSGLHVLLDLGGKAVRADKTLVLTAVSRPVARLLRLTGADEVLTVNDWSGEVHDV